DRLPRPGVRCGQPFFRKQDCNQGEWSAKPEYRWPTPELHEQSAEQGPGGRADRVHQREDANGTTAPVFREQPGDQRRGAADDQRRADPLQKSAEEEPAVIGRYGAEQIGHTAPNEPDAKDATVAPDVADASEGQHQAG